MPPALPFELIQLIISNLERDNLTLKILCQVSHSFLITARKFMTIYPFHIENFLKLIDRPQETFSRACPRVLNIRHGTGLSWFLTWRSSSTGKSVFDVLQNIHTLSLESLVFTQISGEAKQRLADGFQSVKKLDITAVLFSTCDELAELIVSFPMLKQLKFEKGHVVNMDRSLNPSFTPILSTLSISSTHTEVLRFFAAHPIKTLKVLQVQCCEMDKASSIPIAEMVASCGPSLDTLLVSAGPASHESREDHEQNLRRLSDATASLTNVICLILDIVPTQYGVEPFILAFLENIALKPNRIKTICFPSIPGLPPHSRLEDVFLRTRWTMRVQVEIAYRYEGKIPSRTRRALDNLQRHLPRLIENGILQIEQVDAPEDILAFGRFVK